MTELKLQLSDGYATLESVWNTCGLSNVGLLYWKPGYGGDVMKLSPVSRPRRRPRLSKPSAGSFAKAAKDDGRSTAFFEPCFACASSSEKTSCAERLCLRVVGEEGTGVTGGREITLSSTSYTQRAIGHVFYDHVRSCSCP